MIPANVSLGALLDQSRELRAELARRDRQLALRADWLLALRAEVERLRAELARRDEQIAAVRALAAKWWCDPRHNGDGEDILTALGLPADGWSSVEEIAGLYSGQEIAKGDYR